jgi:TolB-like protein
MRADYATSAIELAREPAFTLGTLEVRPATREVVAGSQRELLEPRVMQVLVALARRRGEVVSRDDLLHGCWGGRVVGEDALQRCVARLRRLAEQLGGFSLQNVPRVGYRLDEASPREGLAASAPLLAVLPFENLSGDPDMSFFSDGLAEEILNRVTRHSLLKAIGRTSSFQLRGSAKAAENVRAQLHATHLLDGSVQRSGERVRVSAQLVECEGQTTIWSDRFDRRLADALALQDEIAEAVVTSLEYKLEPRPEGANVDPATLDLFLRARRRGTGDVVGATPADWLDRFDVQLLVEATSRSPDFAEVWAALALACAIEAQSTTSAPTYQLERARAVEAAERALAIGGCSAMAYSALSLLEPTCGRFAERQRLLDLALASQPDDPIALYQASLLMARLGRIRDGYALVRRAHEIDPLSSNAAFWRAKMLYDLGRQAEALEAWDVGRRRWPRHEGMSGPALYYAACAGDWARVDEIEAFMSGAGPWSKLTLANLEAAKVIRHPTPELRRQVVSVAREQLARTGTLRFTFLGYLSVLGLIDEAYELVEAASFDHLFATGPATIRADTDLHPLFEVQNAPLRADPRFVSLCARLGLTRHWLDSNCWPDCASEAGYDFRAACAEAERPRQPRPGGDVDVRVGDGR